MNKALRAFSALALVATVSAAQAVMIDDFTSGAYSITSNSLSPTNEAVRLGTMLGGERDALLTYLGGPQSVNAIVQIGGGGAQFYNEASETNGLLTLQYDGLDGEIENGVLNPGTGLGGNFSGDSQFEMFFPFIDAGLGAQVSVTITVVTNTGTFSNTSMINNGTNIMHNVAFSNFVGANFSNVQRLEFTFGSPAAADFTLDFIRTGGGNIPGPAALVPFLVGMASLARRRRRR
jgi:hypothetical protein